MNITDGSLVSDPRVTGNRIRLVQGDTGPQIRVTLSNQVTGEPIDLTGAEVAMHFRSEDTGETLFSRPLVISPDTAVQGMGIIVWSDTDLEQPPGYYEAEIEAVLSSGIRQTAYDVLKFHIREDYA